MNIEEIEKDYNSGMLKKDIITKHHITMGQLNYQISKNNWKKRAKKGIIGNKGGYAPKGNKNAVITGAYENIFNTVLSEEEKVLFNTPIEDKRIVIEKDIRLLEVREFRMMSRISELKNKATEMVIVKITKKIGDKEGTTTEVERIIAQIQRIEAALTQVQEAKRRSVDSLHKLEFEEKRFNYEKSKDDANKPRTNAERIEIINDLPYNDELDMMKNE